MAQKRFRVALSFPSEHRQFVAKVARLLVQKLGKERVFYDRNFEAELAQLNLDTYLQRLYRDESDLIVVFLCVEYERKEWCGLEWRAIRDLLKQKQASAIMPMRFDDMQVPGLFSIDGYVNLTNRRPTAVARLILQRLDILDTERNSSCMTTAREPVSEKNAPTLGEAYQQAVQNAYVEAVRQRSPFVGTPHLCLALCAMALDTLRNLHVSLDAVIQALLVVTDSVDGLKWG